MICLYVDDLLVTGSTIREIEEFKQDMKATFEMTDLGTLTYFLGMEFATTSDGIILHQRKYVTEVLKRFNMSGCNSITTPVEVNVKLDRNSEEKTVDCTMFKQIVGSLRYICNSRPDICFGVGLISRFMDDPRKSHFIAAKRIMKYLQGTLEYGVLFPNRVENAMYRLTGFSDLDWCGDQVDRRSTSGYLFKFLDAPISWCTKKQPVIALSSCNMLQGLMQHAKQFGWSLS